MTLSAALFDLDGTLTDPEVGITTCIAYGLRNVGAEVPEQAVLRDWIGAPLQATFLDYLGSKSRADDALAWYRERFTSVGIFENKPYDGIADAIAAVRGDARTMLVVTSKPTVFARRIVDHFGLAQYFDEIYGSELDGRFTDKKELIDHVVTRHSIDTSGAVMIGDRRYDVTAARHNGVAAVGVLWGFGSPDELRSAGAHALCSEVPDLFDTVLSVA